MEAIRFTGLKETVCKSWLDCQCIQKRAPLDLLESFGISQHCSRPKGQLRIRWGGIQGLCLCQYSKMPSRSYTSLRWARRKIWRRDDWAQRFLSSVWNEKENYVSSRKVHQFCLNGISESKRTWQDWLEKLNKTLSIL